MSVIEETLQQYFQQYPQRDIVIAYSGGVDSQVLLHALASLKAKKNLPNPISACHVNHGLSANALQWQTAAESYCKQLHIPLIICPLKLAKIKQQSLEAVAREARYKALKESSPENALIVTGHHGDDQAETFLLALKRGAGVKGLSAMKKEVFFDKQLLVRPLLSISRDEIEQYAKNNQISWQEDESNTDLNFDRNFIRHKIMPLLTQRWPSIFTTMHRSSKHCQDSQILLDELAEMDLARCLSTNQRLNITLLKSLSVRRFNNLLRFYLSSKSQLMPTTQQLDQIYHQLDAKTDKSPAVKLGSYWLRFFQQEVYITKDFNDISQWQQALNIDEKLPLPDGLGELNVYSSNTPASTTHQSKSLQRVVAPNSQQQVTIKFCHNNEKCLPDYRNHSRSIKKVMQELAIPPWQRKRVPFLYYDDVLVAAVGYFVCQPFMVSENKENTLLLFIEKSE